MDTFPNFNRWLTCLVDSHNLCVKYNSLQLLINTYNYTGCCFTPQYPRRLSSPVTVAPNGLQYVLQLVEVSDPDQRGSGHPITGSSGSSGSSDRKKSLGTGCYMDHNFCGSIVQISCKIAPEHKNTHGIIHKQQMIILMLFI